MRKGDRTKTLLKILKVSALTIKEIIGVFDAPEGSIFDYGATYGQRRFYQQRIHDINESKRIDRDREVRKLFATRQQLYETVSRLKNQGLIIESPKTGRLKLLLGGKKKLRELQTKRLSFLPQQRYSVEKDTALKIVSFDIPEKERRKRVWLRTVLRELKFKFVQQSLWMGYSKIPKDFLDDLSELRLLKCVKIFAVSKTGNLDEIKNA